MHQSRYLRISIVTFGLLVLGLASLAGFGATASAAPAFPECPQATVMPGSATFIYCTTQSASDPTQFNITMIISNQTSYDLDLSHTIVCNLQSGTNIPKVVAPANNVTVLATSNTLIWTPAVVPAGQSRTISFFITKAVNSDVLVNSVKITGINQVLKSPFTAVLTQFGAEAETRTTSLNVSSDIPNAPATGFKPDVAAPVNLSLPALTALIAIIGIAGLKLNRRNKRNF